MALRQLSDAIFNLFQGHEYGTNTTGTYSVVRSTTFSLECTKASEL
jgi:hypothetical protein